MSKLLGDVARVLPPPGDFDDRAMEIYLDELDDLPLEVVAQALLRIVRTELFFPKIADIRRVAAENLVDAPNVVEALFEVERMLTWSRLSEEERGERPDIHPVVKRAVDAMGGFATFKTSESPASTRGQFMKLYREIRAGVVIDFQTGRALQAPLSQAAIAQFING